MSSHDANGPRSGPHDANHAAAHTQINRRRLLQMMGVGGVLLGGGPLLSACGSDSSSSGSSPDTAGSSTQTSSRATSSTTAGTSPEAETSGSLQSGGSLTIALSGAGANGQLDPHQPLGDTVASWALASFFENLGRFAPDGKTLNMLVAEEISPDADGKTWTVRIKDGIEFHNGKTVDADDVMFSLNRAVTPPAYAGAQVGEFENMKKVDARTVEFTLVQPRGWFDVGVSTGGIIGIVPADFDPSNPVSTGPFKYASTVEGVSVTLERFENYHGDVALLDELILLPIKDPAAGLNALVSNEAQVYVGIGGSQIAQIESNDAFNVYQSPGGFLNPLQMRTDVGALADPRVRQALRLVVDREQIVQSVYGGFADVGNDLYGESDELYTLGLQRERDVAAAQALMDEVGGEVDVTLTVLAGAEGEGLVLAENAKEIGINVTVQSVDGGTLYGPDYLEWEFLSGDRYPPSSFFTTGSLVDAPNAAIGNTHFEDAEFTAAWEEASPSTDPEARSEGVNQMQQILFDRGGWLLPALPFTLGAYSADVGGFVSPDVTGLGLNRWWEKIGYKA